MKSITTIAINEIAHENEALAKILKTNISAYTQQAKTMLVWAWDMSVEEKNIVLDNMALIKSTMQKHFGNGLDIQALAA